MTISPYQEKRTSALTVSFLGEHIVLHTGTPIERQSGLAVSQGVTTSPYQEKYSRPQPPKSRTWLGSAEVSKSTSVIFITPA